MLRDLPLVDREELEQWHSLVVPRWLDYVFSVPEDPWCPGDVVEEAQAIWEEMFSDSNLKKYRLAQSGEPVFYLVSAKSPLKSQQG